MSIYALSKFTSPNAGVSVSTSGDALSTTTALGQAIQNIDQNAVSNPMNAAGDIIYGGASGTPSRLPTGSGPLLGGTTPAYAGAPIGPTFATGNTTMTNAGTWYTGATLVSALSAGGIYLIGGTISLTVTSGDAVSYRIFDLTNSVSIAEVEPPQGQGRSGASLMSIYSGYSGTPTIVIQANDATTAGRTIVATLFENGATNKATQIWAQKLG